jgi:hypothetical protein
MMLNGKMFLNDELGRVWKASAVTCFRRMLDETEEKYESSQNSDPP